MADKNEERTMAVTAAGVENAGHNAGAVDALRSAIQDGGQLQATNKVGVTSGVTNKGRELTAAEALWQQRRQESTAAYNERKAEREDRRAANTDNARDARWSTLTADAYRAKAAEASRLAEGIQEDRAQSALDKLREHSAAKMFSPADFGIAMGMSPAPMQGAIDAAAGAAREMAKTGARGALESALRTSLPKAPKPQAPKPQAPKSGESGSDTDTAAAPVAVASIDDTITGWMDEDDYGGDEYLA